MKTENMYIYILKLLNKQNKIEYYVGITNNPDRRYAEHSEKVGGRYTKGRQVLQRVWLATVDCRSTALLIEGFLKKPENRRLKLMLIGELPWTPKMKQRWKKIQQEWSVIEIAQ